MKNQNIQSVITVIRTAFETRNFTPFVDLFCDDGVYEVPFTLDAAHAKVTGIDAIRKRFDMVTNSPWNKAVKIETVTLKQTDVEREDAVLLQFNISGIRNSDGQAFDFQSSVALIHFRDGKISLYQDYPNVLGINKAAGFLNQFAETLKG